MTTDGMLLDAYKEAKLTRGQVVDRFRVAPPDDL